MSRIGLFTRWFSRVFSVILALIILAIFVGEVANSENLNPPGLSPVEILKGTFFLITWLGFSVGWYYERLGGAMIVVGLVAFYVTQYVDTGTIPGGLFFLFMLIPGVLYFVSSHMNRESDRKDDASGG